MDLPLDLSAASREELIEIIGQLHSMGAGASDGAPGAGTRLPQVPEAVRRLGAERSNRAAGGVPAPLQGNTTLPEMALWPAAHGLVGSATTGKAPGETGGVGAGRRRRSRARQWSRLERGAGFHDGPGQGSFLRSFKSPTRNWSSLASNSHDHREGPFTVGSGASLRSTGQVPTSTE